MFRRNNPACGRNGSRLPVPTATDVKAERAKKDSAKRLDPSKLRIQFCPAATAERIAKGAVLRALRRRAKSAGKKVSGGTESIVGPKKVPRRSLAVGDAK